jgi:hypothetical protein
MSRLSSVRFASALALAALLFASGVVAGAAGDPLILGSLTNSSGSQGTQVSTNVNGNAFRVVQSGSGNDANGLRGDASDGTGGVFTSSNNNALFVTAAHADRRGLVARNGAAVHGTGAALLAQGFQNTAIEARTANGASYAVDARNSASGGIAVYGLASATSGGAFGVWGESPSPAGYGVLGYATATTGDTFGVLGRSDSSSGRAVFGVAAATSGQTYGVYGQSDSTDGRGVNGFASAISGFTVGVHGESDSPNGRGVVGYATAASGTTYGVLGLGISPDGYAGYFGGRARVTGDLVVNGTVTKGGGAFRIDHPLDPANSYLQHSFVESPDMLNVYNGNVTTDVDGEAVVELPDWFEALNQDFRYQLTTIGAPAQAWVATKVADNSFTIATDQPNIEVSWQVTGIRRDPWADANRIVVELDKTGDERGLYLHPELYGKPESAGLDALHAVDPAALEVPAQP